MRAVEFLTELWTERPGALIQLWSKDTKTSNYLRSPLGADVIVSAHGRVDVYTAVGLAHKDLGRKTRAHSRQIITIAGLWLDIDVNGGPDSKTGSAPTVDAAIDLAKAIAAPTLLVGSGYGIHAWYLLHEPWRFASVDEQQQAATASAQWYALHRAVARERGYGLDHTHDLARLLRVPGTVNGKGGGAAPVEVIEHGGGRYARAGLLDVAALAGPVEVSLAPARETQSGQVVGRPRSAPPAKLDVLAYNSPEFAAAMAHEGRPGWTTSEWDLSLCSQAAQAGWTDQELADLIAWHRRSWDVADRKWARAKYVRDTIAKARSRAVRDEAALTLDQLRRAA